MRGSSPMAASRTRPTKTDPLDRLFLESTAQALRDAETRAQSRSDDDSALRRRVARPAASTVIVGYSGGRDSTALLHVLARLSRQRGSGVREVIAVHVHHGLSRRADDWLVHCEQQATQIGTRFMSDLRMRLFVSGLLRASTAT